MDTRLNGTCWGELPEAKEKSPAIVTPNFFEDYLFTDMEELTAECLIGIEKSRIREQRRRARAQDTTTARALFIGLWILLLIASAIIGGLQ